MTRQKVEPGGRMAAPDPDLRLLQAFVNTADLEGGSDALAEPARASAWLSDTGLVGDARRISARDHERLLEVREALRRLGAANNGERLDAAELRRLDDLFASVQLVASVGTDGLLLVKGRGGVADVALGRLLGTLARASADGSWARMKACRMHSCRWLFWDASRNRSGTWCTMAICGSREKSRAYRERQRG
jgi:predicted RNA-binding Zn ribbon-like protein